MRNPHRLNTSWLIGLFLSLLPSRSSPPPDAAFFGEPSSVIQDRRELLPGFWRVVLTGGRFPSNWHELRRVILVEGKVEERKGVPVFLKYFERYRPKAAKWDVFILSELMEHFSAFPEGFDRSSIEAKPSGESPLSNLDLIVLHAPVLLLLPPNGAPVGGYSEPAWRRARLRAIKGESYRYQFIIEIRRSTNAEWEVERVLEYTALVD